MRRARKSGTVQEVRTTWLQGGVHEGHGVAQGLENFQVIAIAQLNASDSGFPVNPFRHTHKGRHPITWPACTDTSLFRVRLPLNGQMFHQMGNARMV